ncbi:MAG: rhodanese-related sulfurtransferase [Bdellovibrionales bacterium]
MTYTVAALYRFVAVADPSALRETLKPAFADLGICGSLLIAPEGINGTLAGTAENIDAMLKLLETHCGLPRDVVKFSSAPEKPFNRLKIRLKRETITFEQPHVDPTQNVGTYVTPSEWDALTANPDVLLLDTRNTYETDIGMFKGAVDPRIENFTDFAAYVRENLDPKKHKRVAMYCTGGIRCEKASAFMLAEGFEEVFHLQGGILKYLEEIPAEHSTWDGDCYVFDKRMAVGHGLSTGAYRMCFGCGRALDATARAHPHYEDGVSCEHCHAVTSDEDKERFRERHRQMSAQ